MSNLHDKLATLVDQWRAAGYPSGWPALAEVFEWSVEPDSGALRFLRPPQLKALETYWYLRAVRETPHVSDLYREVFPPQDDLPGYLAALGVPEAAFRGSNYDLEKLEERIRDDDEFVRSFDLEALRETLELSYPSYILALAMGAGKTMLIGAIIATEFAMALDEPDGPFVQNALVFAPGKTILESLRELAAVPYEKILPPRLHKRFAASLKLTFTRDGEKDVPVIRGSSFNVVVTNTEKIRIQKETIRKSDLGGLFAPGREEEQRAEVANLRLQGIASLPHLAVFSDEAHHTYGQSLDTELKKVRKTVDYLAANTNVLCVVNTTGTPYFQRQLLRDVVVWYGLSEGIRDGILKDLKDSIFSYEFADDARPYVRRVVLDFFETYGDVSLPNGARSKLALYFPQTHDLRDLRATVDEALVTAGHSPSICLVNTSDTDLTKQADIEAFNRLNDPRAPHRVILLVNKGTEGWNCPSLFACALVRRLKTSNNFVLQAATRCLRQVPGNVHKARVYLSSENYGVLDRQLQETYGETITSLNERMFERRRARVVVRKPSVPPVVVTRRTTVVEGRAGGAPLALRRPKAARQGGLRQTIHTPVIQEAVKSVLQQLGSEVELPVEAAAVDLRSAAVELAARYRVDAWLLYDQLRLAYGSELMPAADVPALADQVEKSLGEYRTREETADIALAIVRLEGFDKEELTPGEVIYTAEITYHRDKENLLMRYEAFREPNPGDVGFHYSPYDFDSKPEKHYFEQLLHQLALEPGEIEDVYFTGGVTDPTKSDFFVEYKDEKGKWRRYTPDFVIRRKPEHGGPPGSGRILIVEIKADNFRAVVEVERAAGKAVSKEGRKALALRAWEDLNPHQIRYELIYTTGSTVGIDRVQETRRLVEDGW